MNENMGRNKWRLGDLVDDAKPEVRNFDCESTYDVELVSFNRFEIHTHPNAFSG